MSGFPNTLFDAFPIAFHYSGSIILKRIFLARGCIAVRVTPLINNILIESFAGCPNGDSFPPGDDLALEKTVVNERAVAQLDFTQKATKGTKTNLLNRRKGRQQR
jgi:hypothetical protein